MNAETIAADGSMQPSAAQRPPTVLLAEDDEEMLALLEAVLRAEGYLVIALKDGSELLEALSEASRFPFAAPDVIVSDVRMPGYSGLHVLAALRAAGWQTPVILVTGFGSDETHRQARTLGAHSVLDKPFELRELVREIARATRPEASESPGA